MVCSVPKFIRNFAMYCGKNEDTKEVVRVVQEEARLAHKVVLDLVTDV
jgi:hypothetical protein